MWVNASGLIARYGAEEIAQRADRGVPRLVSADLLKAAASGGDLSGYTEEERSAAQAALETISGAINDANSTVNGYLASRYKLPIVPAPASVQRIAADIARFNLYDDQTTEAIQKRYDAGIAVLRDISKGNISLGDQPDSAATTTGNSVRVESAGSVWRRNNGGFL